MTVGVKPIIVRVYDSFGPTDVLLGSFESFRYIQLDDIITYGEKDLHVRGRIEVVTLDGEHYLDVFTDPAYFAPKYRPTPTYTERTE